MFRAKQSSVKADNPAYQLRNVYWRKLAAVDIPSYEAKQIANAIALYDLNQTPPTDEQKMLMGTYCEAMSHANLWRLELMLQRSSVRRSSVRRSARGQRR
ncbi:MAG: hypothetical protein AAFY78_14225 [Cyanobacteria bacterium J06648_16]